MSYWGSYGYGYSTYGAGSSRYGYGYSEAEDLLEEGKENDGKVGLSNIGNTCFMNSALQCIFHNELLKRFFLSPRVEEEINENNPLGTKGLLFKELAKLFQSYYRTRGAKVTPSRFKSELGTQNPMFEGYQQHDSQEFWSYVIDVVHEDSNRILKKPYVEGVEGKGKEDDYELARKSWVTYLRRNYSVVTENFIGQFKSRVDCTTPGCHNTSVTFDPFTLVPLSIPNLMSGRFDYFVAAANDWSELNESSFSARSIKNYFDIKVRAVKEGLVARLGPGHRADRFRLGLFNTTGEGEVYEDGDSLGKIQEKRGYGFVGKPSLFLCELSASDMAFAEGPDPLVVTFSLKRDSYDYPPEKKSENDWYGYYSSTRRTEPRDETQYTRFLYLSAKSTIRDLHIAILEKVYYLTNLCSAADKAARNLDRQAFAAIWARMEAVGSTERFFYIKKDDVMMSRNLLDETIESELGVKGGKMAVAVFIRGAPATKVEVNLYQRQNYESWAAAQAKPDSDFVSPLASEFQTSMTMEGLLKSFEQTEVLDDQNLWRCPACKQEVAAKKSMSIYKAPHFLTIHFKKLKQHHNKIPLVSFPVEFDLSPYVLNKENIQGYKVDLREFMGEPDLAAYQAKGKDPAVKPIIAFGNGLKYRLYGIVNHYGSQNFGHYTSACEVGGEWTDFNDGTVSPTSPDRLVSEEAYILFYKRI